jgi:hypothetical protein
MSGEINVVQRTQYIIVEPSSASVSVINAGPVGPAGPAAIPPGGTTGQVLRKKSNTNYDVEWVTLP